MCFCLPAFSFVIMSRTFLIPHGRTGHAFFFFPHSSFLFSARHYTVVLAGSIHVYLVFFHFFITLSNPLRLVDAFMFYASVYPCGWMDRRNTSGRGAFGHEWETSQLASSYLSIWFNILYLCNGSCLVWSSSAYVGALELRCIRNEVGNQ